MSTELVVVEKFALSSFDDVDRDTAKVDGKFLKYDSSSGKFVGDLVVADLKV